MGKQWKILLVICLKCERQQRHTIAEGSKGSPTGCIFGCKGKLKVLGVGRQLFTTRIFSKSADLL